MDVDKEFDEIMTELYWETEGYTSKSPKIPDIQARLDKFVERLTIFNDDDREDPSLRMVLSLWSKSCQLIIIQFQGRGVVINRWFILIG